MSITERIVDQLFGGLLKLIASKHQNNLQLIEDVQKLSEAMHKHYLECYDKYDKMLMDKQNISLIPHPALLEITRDSTFSIHERDKLNGIAKFESGNVAIDDYLRSVKWYMQACANPEMGHTHYNSFRALLLKDMLNLLRLDIPRDVKEFERRMVIALEEDRTLHPLLPEDGRGKLLDVTRSRFGISGVQANDPATSFHLLRISVSRLLLVRTVLDHRRYFENVSRGYFFARQSLG